MASNQNHHPFNEDEDVNAFGEASLTAWMNAQELEHGIGEDSLELPLGGSTHNPLIPVATAVAATSREDWCTDQDGDMFASPTLLSVDEDAPLQNAYARHSNHIPEVANNNKDSNEESLNLSALAMSDDNGDATYYDYNYNNGGNPIQIPLNEGSFDEHDLTTAPLNDTIMMLPSPEEEEFDRPKTIRFAETVATPFGSAGTAISIVSESGSLQTDDIFMEDAAVAKPLSYQNLDEESEGSIDLGIYDDDQFDEDMNDEPKDELKGDEEKKEEDGEGIMWAVGGTVATYLFGWTMRKLLSKLLSKLFSHQQTSAGQEDDAAAAAQHTDTATHTIHEATMSAMPPPNTGDPSAALALHANHSALTASTASASQSQSFFAAGALPGNSGMSAAQ